MAVGVREVTSKEGLRRSNERGPTIGECSTMAEFVFELIFETIAETLALLARRKKKAPKQAGLLQTTD
jgi:hypothetical protein